MNLLVTLDSNYVHQLMVMLKSFECNNPNERLTVYVIHTRLTKFDLAKLRSKFPAIRFVPIVPDDKIFDGAHFTKRITKETYYRLLLCEYLPKSVDRILYLDPDTVILRSLSRLYNYSFGDKCIVGAGHMTGLIEWINRKRLNMADGSQYINAGVLMINVDNMRKIADLGEIKRYINKKGRRLFQADQDVINALYHKQTAYIRSEEYNLDERTYKAKGLNLQAVDESTCIIHYDGKNKPWKDDYNGELGKYYYYYEELFDNGKEILLSAAN